MASGRGLAALVLLAGLASGKILMFENKDPKSAHYHSHTETLAATPSNKSTSPYVSFDVKCPAGASKVLWMVVNTDLRGIGRWHEENDTIISARCGADIVPTCDGGTGDPDDAVTTGTSFCRRTHSLCVPPLSPAGQGTMSHQAWHRAAGGGPSPSSPHAHAFTHTHAQHVPRAVFRVRRPVRSPASIPFSHDACAAAAQ